MSRKLLDRIQRDDRFICTQCPNGSWDVWFNSGGHFVFHQESGKPIGNDKVLSGIFRDTKEFDKIIGNLLNKINKKKEE